MDLGSARDLKAELLANVVAPFTTASTASPRARRAAMSTPLAREFALASPLAMSARPLDAVPDVARSVALGVARKGKNYRLAVRVQRQSLMGSSLVEHIVSQAKGEADVRLVGRIEKRLARAAAAVPWNRGRVRPLMIGVSVGHVNVTAGTIGAFVKKGTRTLILSNNHVLADENRGKSGDAVLQPGAFDGGTNPEDEVAKLRSFVRLKTPGVNFVDVALAEIDPGIQFDASTLTGLIGGANRTLAGVGPDFLDEGTIVHKLGRTTGATEGRVTAFELDNVVVAYDIGNVRFDDQVEIEGVGNAAFSDGGDSGSLIVNDDLLAVALLFAGGDTGGSNGLGLTYANPIHRVLSDTKATLLF